MISQFIEKENLKHTFPYLDNVTVAGKTQAERDANVRKVFLEVERDANVKKVFLEAERDANVKKVFLEAERDANVKKVFLEAEHDANVKKVFLEAERDANVKKVFLEAINRNNFILNDSKTITSVSKIQILGYEVGHGLIKPDPERLRPLKEFPPPTNFKLLHRVLWMFAYYGCLQLRQC